MAVLQLLPSENQALLIRRNSFFVLNLSFDIIDGVAGLNVERDGFARQRLDKDLHATAEPEDQVER